MLTVSLSEAACTMNGGGGNNISIQRIPIIRILSFAECYQISPERMSVVPDSLKEVRAL